MRLSLLLLLLAGVPALRGQTNWTVTRFGLANVNTAFGIAYGKGRFVATVQGGPRGMRLATSLDGITWQDTPVNGGGRLYYFADAFHFSGGGGVWRSTNGVSWEQIYNAYATQVGFSFQRETHNGRGMLIDAGYFNGVLIYSEDLVSWSRTTSLPFSGMPGAGVSITHLAFGAGRYFVAYSIANAPGFNGSYTASTVDGKDWVLVPELRGAQGLAGGNGRLVGLAGGRAHITTDGTTFTSAATPADMFNPQRLFFAGGRFLAARTMHASTDGLTWSRLASFEKPDSADILQVAYGAGRYVAVGFEIVPPNGAVDVLAHLAAVAPPLIARQPVGATQAEGGRATFSVSLDNPDVSTTFQWRRDGAVLPGATSPSLTIEPVLAGNAGRYSVDVRNTTGTSFSDPASLTVVPAGEAGRIVNLSVLTSFDAAGADDGAFTVGFVVGGRGTFGGKALLVRAAGPSLDRFGVASPAADPRIELFSPAGKIAENDNWNGTSVIAEAASRVGAFPFASPVSKDAAVYSEVVPAGNATLRISASGGGTGAVLAEVYDATPPASVTASTPRLINVSVLKPIAAGATLSAGFVIAGSTERTVLIRAVGPGLEAFNVGGALADPRLSLFKTGTSAAIAANDDWAGTERLATAFGAVGAFNLRPTSRDAALLVSLAPGNYVAEASGAGAGGMALIEVYDVP